MSLEKKEPTRRKFLGLAGAAALTGAAVMAANEFRKSSPEHTEQEGFKFLNVVPNPRAYQTGVLEHRKFSPRLSHITGIIPVVPHVPNGPKKGTRPQPRVPHEAHVDFSVQLARMWIEKVRLMEHEHGAIPETRRTDIKKLFTEYNSGSAEKMSLVSYRGRINTQMEEARAGVPLANLKHLKAFADLTQTQVELVRALERRITSSTLLACSMTELMPTSGHEAAVGVEVYDWLLKNAGDAYIEDGMPALGDGEFSFGPYQFIPGALSDASGEPRGARLIEQLSHDKQLPADLGRLQGAQQHRAAYLFAVHNLALLVRRLDQNASERLFRLLPQMPADLVTEFVAVSHHNPHRAMNVFQDYLREYETAAQHPEKYRKPDFVDCCKPEGDLGPYARKTRDNLRALRAHFADATGASR